MQRSSSTIPIKSTIGIFFFFSILKINRGYFRYIFIVRDGIGNCLEIILDDVEGLPIEIQSRTYIFHQIEYLERIDQPKESHRWPYDDYLPPKKLFCFRSSTNRVSLL